MDSHRRDSQSILLEAPLGSTAANDDVTDAAANTTSNAEVTSVVQDTELVTAIKQNTSLEAHQHDMKKLLRHAKGHEEHPELEQQGGLSVYEDDLKARLQNAVFVGHVNTDLDSVAGAIGAAALFGGTPALAEPHDKLNGEITFALQNCGIPAPPFLDDLPHHDTCDIVLVDHTEEKQMVPSLVASASKPIAQRVVGVIDHHALAKSFQTVKPIYIDLRPWGSMSTIVGYLFLSHRKFLPKPLAVLLLHAILSDTLNLRSVTTTNADRSMVALLSAYGGLGTFQETLTLKKLRLSTSNTCSIHSKELYQDTDIDLLAKRQFQAKTNWVVALGPYEMVRGDQKDFACGPWKFGISVLEVTQMEPVLACSRELLLELRLLKKEKGLQGKQLNRTLELDFAFLFVVNVVQEYSVLLICGGRELALAKAAFLDSPEKVQLKEAFPGIQAPGSTVPPNETAMVLPKGYVSRKAQFVPAFFKALQDFCYSNKTPRSEAGELPDVIKELKASQVQAKIQAGKMAAANNNPKQQRRRSSLEQHFVETKEDMANIIQREDKDDEDLLKINERVAEQHNGNLYDAMGRVVRTYENAATTSAEAVVA